MTRLVTGIKPTGTPHLGNYLGTIRPSLELAREYDAFYFIADYHALTLIRDGEEVRHLSYEVAATWLALGLDADRTVLYRQSDIPQVCELAWVLSCVAAKGLMNRAHAYKAAVDENRERDRDPDAGVNMGLYNYPILMAADILLPAADAVPVGLDQKQHIEITQDIAEAFNAVYGPLLTVPEAAIREDVMVIPGLDGRKMSKSYDNTIQVLSPPDVMRKAVMRIKTDSRPPEEPKDPDEDTIYALYRHLASPDDVAAMAERYRAGGLGYGQAKGELFAVLDETFAEPRRRYAELLADTALLDRILADGADRVRDVAMPLLDEVRRAVGVGGAFSPALLT